VFVLDLPVTVSLQKALIFGVDSETFAIPAGFILDTMESREKDMQAINRVLLVSWRGDFVRAVDAGRLLGCQGLAQAWARPYAIVLQAGNKRGALLVDWLSGVQEIVVKPLDEPGWLPHGRRRDSAGAGPRGAHPRLRRGGSSAKRGALARTLAAKPRWRPATMSSDATRTDEATGGRAENKEPLLAFADALLASSSDEPGRAAGEIRQYVTFFLRDDEIGIPILQCREIVRRLAITRVPEAPDHVRGVVNLRGRVLPAVDTRKCLGYEASPPTARSRLLVVEVAAILRAAGGPGGAHSQIGRGRHRAAARATQRCAFRHRRGRDGDAVIYLTDAERILRPGPASSAPRSDEA
jgi:chemotaxis signal transduction protein